MRAAERQCSDDAATIESRSSITFEIAGDRSTSDRSESTEESKFFDDATVGDSISHDGEESVGCDGNENLPPVYREGVAAASKVVSTHPFREIARKASTKCWSPVELLAFQARVKEYLLQLFHLSHCFNQNAGRFS